MGDSEEKKEYVEDKAEEDADSKTADIVTNTIDDKPDVHSAQDEPKDWADLSMLEKLDSMHIVTEWHFQNPLRLRQLMRSDDETASWVCPSLV